MNAILAARDLRFAYRRSTQELFNGLTHDFASGAMTAVTGRSGRGKSTLLYILGLMLRPGGGQVTFDGTAMSARSDGERAQLRARRIGFVFQDAVLDLGRPILDSVMEPALYDGQRRREVAARAHQLLTDLGVHDRAGHRPGEISGGQAQRVAVARALINSPEVILADEPTGNLDTENATVVLTALRRAAQTGRTVVIATHDPFVIEQTDVTLHLGGDDAHR